MAVCIVCAFSDSEGLNPKALEEPNRHVTGDSSKHEDDHLSDQDPLEVRRGEHGVDGDREPPVNEAKQDRDQECSAVLPGAGATLT